MVKMIFGIGGITALGDWIQLTLKPEQLVKEKKSLRESINSIVNKGDDSGFLDNLMKNAQDQNNLSLFPDKIRIPVDTYMRDDWNISTRVMVTIEIVKTWKPNKDGKYEWEERNTEEQE